MRASDREEFLKAYQAIHEPLMRFCMVKSRGIMDPKDLLNDVLLVGLEKYNSLKDKKALLSYLFTTANNISLNHLRRRKFSEPYNESAAVAIPVSGNIENKVDVTFLYDALDQLPPLQKEAVVLFEISDLPIKEIMKIQNAGESSVKQRIKRGREKLVAILKEKDRKKIAVAISLLFTTNTFSMSNLNQYFNAIKMMPLPISKHEALINISNLQLPQSAFSKVVSIASKSKLVGTVMVSAAITSVIVLSGSSINQDDTNTNSDQTFTLATTHFEKSPEIPKNENIILFNDELKDDHEKEVNFNSKQLNDAIPPSEPNLMITPFNWTDFKKVISDEQKVNAIPPLTETYHNVPIIDSTDENIQIFNLEGINEIEIGNIGEKINILTWDQNMIKVEQLIEVECKKEQDKTTILNNIKLVSQKDGDRFILKKNAKTKNNSIIQLGPVSQKTIEFENGQKARYKKLKASYVITMPKKINLRLNSKYSDIQLISIEGDLKGQVYESKLNASDIKGNLKMSIKYSKVKLGNIHSGKIEAYESDIDFKNCLDLNLNSKYSDIKCNDVKTLVINSYEDNINLNQSDSLYAQMKYASLTCLNNIRSAYLEAYESQFYAASISDFVVELFSYSLLDIDQVTNLDLTKVYESKLMVDEIQNISALNSKYTSYSIKKITKQAKVSSYEDNLLFSSIVPGFEQLKFDGKYTKYSLSVDNRSSFEIDINSRYSGLNYSKLDLKNRTLTERNENTVLNGISNGTIDSTLGQIKFDCYEGAIVFK